MPKDLIVDVIGSTLADRVHKGGRQAGFKSAISYRNDIGIPGYTGYVPSTVAIQVPTKGSTVHTGRVPESDNAPHTEQLLKATNTLHNKTEYGKTFTASQKDYKLLDKTGGGYWFNEAGRNSKKHEFIATTTYGAEVLHAGETTEKQLQPTMGLHCTLANYEAARRCQSADVEIRRAHSLSSTTRPVPGGGLLGYTTEYSSMVVPNPVTGGSAAAGAPRTSRAIPEPRYKVMPPAMKPGLGSDTMYRQNFGRDGSDPCGHSSFAANMTRAATTHELAEGTTRAVGHVPGYSGHIAASPYNVVGKQQTQGLTTRLDIKGDMLDYSLDQYPRSRLPGYTGFKPQAADNITSTQPAQGPTAATATGLANALATARAVHKPDNVHFIDSRKGLMSFFTGGTETVSDNGLANAQQYFGHIRPLEGRPYTNVAPKTTVYGLKFNH